MIKRWYLGTKLQATFWMPQLYSTAISENVPVLKAFFLLPFLKGSVSLLFHIHMQAFRFNLCWVSSLNPALFCLCRVSIPFINQTWALIDLLSLNLNLLVFHCYGSPWFIFTTSYVSLTRTHCCQSISTIPWNRLPQSLT